MIGQRLGRYRIVEHLGMGGMSTVFKAVDVSSSLPVAIKIIRPETVVPEALKQRLRREVRAVTAIDHPAVTKIHEVITHNGVDHVVMEYLDGQLLSELLDAGPLDVITALSIARQVAEGLQAAHDIGIVHRDVKAENIMVIPGGIAKILDFGLSKQLDPGEDDQELTPEGIVAGTAEAMSPEQAQGLPVSARSDLFSLGTMIYQMVAGLHPFATLSPIGTLQRIVTNEPKPVGSFNPEIPPALEGLIARLLAKQPEQRPPSAADVARELAAMAT